MQNTKLFYGMKLRMRVNPITIIVMGLAIASSNETIEADFIVSKYWEDDDDANKYKVKLIPTEKYQKICGNEKFYSSDLISNIKRGSAKIID